MTFREAIEKYKKFKFPPLSVICENVSYHQKTCISIVIIAIILSLIFIYISLFWFPHWQVAQFGINNSIEVANLENSYRATLAQILGGSAVAVGIYFAWGNLKTAREGQIIERFTRAVDQLGNPAIEIKLGGIYALERISMQSDKDYWPIMEILTAYVKKNSPCKMGIKLDKVSLDIQAILTIIGRRMYSFNAGELNCLDLQKTYLREADLKGAHLEGINFMATDLSGAHLSSADLTGANLEGAILEGAILEKANLEGAILEGAILEKANLEGAILEKANLEKANLEGAILEKANLEGAILEKANLEEANLEGAQHLSFDQLSKVNTLYNAKLDDKFLIPLKDKYPTLFEEPE